MNRQELLASLRTWFQKYRHTLWFRITYLVLLGAIIGELFILTQSAVWCLAVLLMPVTAFVVPYWLGERKIRRFALNFLVVMIIALLIAAAMSTEGLLTQAEATPVASMPGQPSNPTMSLANGTVTPFRAPPSSVFTFRVRLTTTINGTPTDYQVALNLTVVTGVSSLVEHPYAMAYRPGNDSSTNTKNGTWYETNVMLGDSIYGYAFSVRNAASNWTFAGPPLLGPVTASSWTFYAFFVYAWGTSLFTTLAVITYFAILFLWWYTLRNREARARAIARSTEASKEGTRETKPTPSAGGKASKAAAFTCTNCGADVEETDAKCPKCGAVFED